MRVAIIFCTWNRVYRLDKTINDLKNQTNNNFDIFIWNNNINEATTIDNIIKNSDRKVNVHHSEINIGGIGRFYYAKEISKNYDVIIFLDDDQNIESDVVGDMLSHYKNKTIVSWWGWKIKKNYWDRDRVFNFSEVDYCGTGGMILDPYIFKDLNLNSIPNEFKFIEDLWLSFIAKYEYGYKLIGGNFNISITVDGNDQYSELKPLKNVFYNYLNNMYINNIKSNNEKIYFLIPSYNRINKLTNLLTQIENETNFGVILYNDGSTDDGYDKLELIYKNVKVINNQKNNSKIKYNETLKSLFNEALNTDGNYFILIPDDFILCKSFQDVIKPYLNNVNITNVFSIRNEGWGNPGWVDGALSTDKGGLELLKLLIDRKSVV